MAYQKLQVERALTVAPSDTINIPNVAGPSVSGTTDGAVPSKLVDSTASFTSGLIGFIVYNTTDGTSAVVRSVDSPTVLTISDNIMASGEAYTLYADDNQGCVLYVGNTGNVRVLTAGNDDVTFVGIAAGAFVPVQVKRVFATDTTATDIVALW
jgi:hypothetical protein